MTSTKKPYYGGSPKATEENMEYFLMKLRELNHNETRMNFRQWLYKMMCLLDLID